MSNILFCITGPSGSGKTTIMRQLMDNELLSFTTRKMREGETNGEDYLFISNEEFDELFESGQLAEWTKYDGNCYGLTMEEVEYKLANDNAFFICDNNGFNQIIEKYNDVVSIFLYADKFDCIDNMKYRGDDMGKVANRLKTYNDEMSNRGQYDYVVKNIRGAADVTAEIIKNIIKVESKERQELDSGSTL
jgi:guanylate kinase